MEDFLLLMTSFLHYFLEYKKYVTISNKIYKDFNRNYLLNGTKIFPIMKSEEKIGYNHHEKNDYFYK